jgi:hypothetical protein
MPMRDPMVNSSGLDAGQLTALPLALAGWVLRRAAARQAVCAGIDEPLVYTPAEMQELCRLQKDAEK